jgi:hypothetical protein
MDRVPFTVGPGRDWKVLATPLRVGLHHLRPDALNGRDRPSERRECPNIRRFRTRLALQRRIGNRNPTFSVFCRPIRQLAKYGTDQATLRYPIRLPSCRGRPSITAVVARGRIQSLTGRGPETQTALGNQYEGRSCGHCHTPRLSAFGATTRRLKSMLWERCLAIGFHPLKARLPDQSAVDDLSGPRGALQSGGNLRRRLTPGHSARPGAGGGVLRISKKPTSRSGSMHTLRSRVTARCG